MLPRKPIYLPLLTKVFVDFVFFAEYLQILSLSRTAKDRQHTNIFQLLFYKPTLKLPIDCYKKSVVNISAALLSKTFIQY